MNNEIIGGKYITFVYCATVYIKRFAFLDHKKIVDTHYSLIVSYRKYDTKYIARSVRQAV